MKILDREPLASSRMKRPGHALLTVAVLSEIISGCHSFSMLVDFTSLEQIQSKNYLKRDASNLMNNMDRQRSHRHGRKTVFNAQHYSDEDQWGQDTDSAYEQQVVDMNDVSQQQDQQTYEGTKRAMLGGAALGTMMAINSAVGMSAGAETATQSTPTSGAVIPEQSFESYSTVSLSQPEVTLPYLESQIQAAEDAIRNNADSHVSLGSTVASIESSTTPSAPAAKLTTTTSDAVFTVATTQLVNDNSGATSTSETNAEFSPSFLRYTQEHIPGWVETGQKIYDATAPKIIASGQKIVAEVDRRVTPVVVEKEHELLGEENSAVLDKSLSSVASAGKMMAGMVGKVITFGIEGGVQIVKATPEVISAGQQMYKTLDEKIVPEVVDTSRKMKMIVDTTVPEVMDTGKHAYDTIMPEVVSVEKQISSTVKSGVEMSMPTVKEIKNKITPELNKIERDVLGEERAGMVDKTVVDVAQQGRDAFQAVEKTIPQVWASGQKTVENVVYTGRSVAKAVPVMVETGKQAYNSVDRGISDALSTTQDIVSDLDRAAGKTAYAIEDNLNVVTGTIDKTLPIILDTGRQVAVTGTEIAKSVEYGSKAICSDVSEFVEDLKTENRMNNAGKRFAATKPIYREITASVNDPNNLGKL